MGCVNQISERRKINFISINTLKHVKHMLSQDLWLIIGPPWDLRLTCGLGHFDQTSVEHALEPSLQVEVLRSPGHWDQQVGRRKFPLLGQQLVQGVWARVCGHSCILRTTKRMRGPRVKTHRRAFTCNVVKVEEKEGSTWPVFCPKPPKLMSPKASVGTSWACLCLSQDSPAKSSGLMASSTWSVLE